MAEYWCENCGCEVDTKIIRKTETWKVFGETINYETDVRVCSGCGEEIFDLQLDDFTLKAVYEIYRKEHNMLEQDDIKNIRRKYGLSRRVMDRLLGWPDGTISRYECGSLPTPDHDRLLKTFHTTAGMQEFLTENKSRLNDTQASRLETRLHEIEAGQEYPDNSDIESIFADSPNAQNGFKALDYEKFAAAVLFFADHVPNISKADLARLLYVSDMSWFENKVLSMTGSRYIGSAASPVPERYDLLLEQMEKDGLIRQESCDLDTLDISEICILPLLTSEMDYALKPNEKDWLEKIWKEYPNNVSSGSAEFPEIQKAFIPYIKISKQESRSRPE